MNVSQVSQIDDSMKYYLGLDPFNQQQIQKIIDNCINNLFPQVIAFSDYQIDFDSNKHQITIIFNTKATHILINKILISNNQDVFRESLYKDFAQSSIKVMAFVI